MTTRLLVGHVLNELAKLPDGSVHCVVTSPPYWSLRAYGTEPQVWGGDPKCAHEWGDQVRSPWANAVKGPNSQGKNGTAYANMSKVSGCFCQNCGAWRGEHGQEPTLELWLQHEVEIFREVRRVLRSDGTCWVNCGDAYATQPNGRSAADTKAVGDDDRTFRDKPVSTIGGIFKNKDRLMLPARLAIALQADGWWLRDEIVWSKANPMPSSIKDRTCPAHEMIYLLSKRPRYFFDYVAIMEPFADERQGRDGAKASSERNRGGRSDGFTKPNNIDPSGNGGRMKRSVWHLALEPFAEAHFATFPKELIRPCIEAGTSAKGCCPDCAAPWQRITRKTFVPQPDAPASSKRAKGQTDPNQEFNRWEGSERGTVEYATLGWYPTCACYGVPDLPDYPERPKRDEAKDDADYKSWIEEWRAECADIDDARADLCAKASALKVKPCTVLDPFGGSGTTAVVSEMLGRDCILTELNPEYARMARKRVRENLGQVKSEIPEDQPVGLPLFSSEVAA